MQTWVHPEAAPSLQPNYVLPERVLPLPARPVTRMSRCRPHPGRKVRFACSEPQWSPLRKSHGTFAAFQRPGLSKTAPWEATPWAKLLSRSCSISRERWVTESPRRVRRPRSLFVGIWRAGLSSLPVSFLSVVLATHQRSVIQSAAPAFAVRLNVVDREVLPR